HRGRGGNLPLRRAARLRNHSVRTRRRPQVVRARRLRCVRPRRGGGTEGPGRVRRDGASRGRSHPRRSPGEARTAARRDDGVQPPAPRKGPHVSGDGRAADPRDHGTPSADPRAPPGETRRHGREARPRIWDSRAAGPSARQEGSDAAFEMIAHEFGEAKLVASVLLYTFGELRREGFDVDGIPVDHLRELFSLMKAGRFAKEATPELVREMARTRSRASEALAVLGVTRMSREDLESIVDEVLRASHDLISARGDAAEKALMGQVMERVRGRADGRLVSEVL